MTPDQLRKTALALPDTTEAPHFNYSSFRVRGKIFATVPPPAEDRVHVFVGEEERQRALALYPDIVEILTWGKKVVGLRVVLSKAPVKLMTRMLREAWRARAPASLLDDHR
jgi:hypothetical protein